MPKPLSPCRAGGPGNLGREEVASEVFQRIGHGGASALVAANTLASFDAAQEIGVDVIEFDVRAHGGELVLAHTVLHARRRAVVRLGEALAHLSGRRFAGLELNVDVKHVGCERAVLDALWRHGLLERAVISSQVAAVVSNVRRREPRARVGISVGGRVARASRRWHDWRQGVLAGLADGRWDAVMLQHRLISAALVDEVAARGGLLYAWTVNEREAIGRLRGLGVHGVTSADPRLFVWPESSLQ
jgi:glycerophosphoryl diester phosphodiesterase